MNEQEEHARARAEAQGSSPSTNSADRARFWAGLNRYLAAEAVHEHAASERETPEPARVEVVKHDPDEA